MDTDERIANAPETILRGQQPPQRPLWLSTDLVIPHHRATQQCSPQTVP